MEERCSQHMRRNNVEWALDRPAGPSCSTVSHVRRCMSTASARQLLNLIAMDGDAALAGERCAGCLGMLSPRGGGADAYGLQGSASAVGEYGRSEAQCVVWAVAPPTSSPQSWHKR
jgi:hypothetical protein